MSAQERENGDSSPSHPYRLRRPHHAATAPGMAAIAAPVAIAVALSLTAFGDSAYHWSFAIRPLIGAAVISAVAGAGLMLLLRRRSPAAVAGTTVRQTARYALRVGEAPANRPRSVPCP